ncbi:MAG: 3-ketoacyl-ACP reductase [Anaerolineae bacterium]|nr:3-ketoacyl-ACP reductase [Anaerolineae bacterium]
MSGAPVALVTGAGRGIGRGIALALAERGWMVAINYRTNHAAAQAALDDVHAASGQGFLVRADIGNLDDHAPLLTAVLEHAGRLDVLVNNAGIAPRVRADMLHVSPESYDEVLGTNLRGTFFLTQRAARVMLALLEQQKIAAPKIITITSISAGTASPNRAEYCLSKAGLAMATALWAARLAEFGIAVYEIRPGIIETDMTASVHETYDRMIAGGLLPIARWGRPEDVGQAVAAIAAGAFPYSTGDVFYVDGGFHVSRL